MAAIMEVIQSLLEVHKKYGNIPIGLELADNLHNLVGVEVDDDVVACLRSGDRTVFCALSITDEAIPLENLASFKAKRDH